MLLLRCVLALSLVVTAGAADAPVLIGGTHLWPSNLPPPGLRGVTAIGAGATTTLAVSGGRVVHVNPWGVQTPGDLEQVSAVATNDWSTSLALLQDGSVRCWGALGDSQPFPPEVISAVQICMGSACVARLADGSVLTWTPATTTASVVPVTGAKWIATSVGDARGMAVAGDGTVVQWGASVPAIPIGTSGIARVALGSGHTVALQDDGTVTCWGDNGHGQCTVPSGLASVIAVAATTSASIALRADGTVVCWGAIDPPPALTGVVDICAGTEHAVALLGDGTIATWGMDSARGAMQPPVGLPDTIFIAPANRHVVAVLADATVRAWGFDNDGQCDVPAGLTGVTTVAAGDTFSLALKSDGTVVHWGTAPGMPAYSNVTEITACGGHALVLHNDGTVDCWGSNVAGESTLPPYMPVVSAHVSAGRLHSAVLTPAGTLVSWGAVAFGAQVRPATRFSSSNYGLITLQDDGWFQTWGLPGDGSGWSFSSSLKPMVDVASSSFAHFLLRGDGSVYETELTVFPSYGTVSAMFTGDSAVAFLASDHAPDDLTIDSTDIPEDAAIGTVIGNLSTSDADAGDTHFYWTYQLESGPVAVDVGSLGPSNPTNGQLVVRGLLDFERHPVIPLLVSSVDPDGFACTRGLVINVTNVNEAPTDITLSGGIVAGAPAGTVAGTLDVVDQDRGDSHSFSLVTGAGATDNAQFTISGTQLLASVPLMAGTAYSIRVRATDAGALSYEKVFAVAPSGGGSTSASGTGGLTGGSGVSGGSGGGCGLGGPAATLLALGLAWRRRRV